MFFFSTHLLLDAARMGETKEIAKQQNPAHVSLYRGQSEENLSEIAPYLFSTEGRQEFAGWYVQNGWGDSWGVWVQSACSMEELHRHFRKFLIVKTEDGEELYFRFYDPRVLRIFLPTCDSGQIREFFGPVDCFIMEDEDAGYALRFRQENGSLKTERMSREEFVAGHSLSTGGKPALQEDNMSAPLSATGSFHNISQPVKPGIYVPPTPNVPVNPIQSNTIQGSVPVAKPGMYILPVPNVPVNPVQPATIPEVVPPVKPGIYVPNVPVNPVQPTTIPGTVPTVNPGIYVPPAPNIPADPVLPVTMPVQRGQQQVPSDWPRPLKPGIIDTSDKTTPHADKHEQPETDKPSLPKDGNNATNGNAKQSRWKMFDE